MSKPIVNTGKNIDILFYLKLWGSRGYYILDAVKLMAYIVAVAAAFMISRLNMQVIPHAQFFRL